MPNPSLPADQPVTPSLTTAQKFERVLSVACPEHNVEPGTRCPTGLGTCSARSKLVFGDES